MAWLLLLVAFVVGVRAATQLAMIGALARERGTPEATFTSLVGTVTGVAVFFAVRALRRDPPLLPTPPHRLPVIVLLGDSGDDAARGDFLLAAMPEQGSICRRR
jgi:hypothetical protein